MPALSPAITAQKKPVPPPKSTEPIATVQKARPSAPIRPSVPAALRKTAPVIPALLRVTKTPYGGVAAAAAFIVLLAVGSFSAVKWINPRQTPGVGSRPAVSGLPASIGGSDAFRAWLGGWKTLDPYVGRAEFENTGSVPAAMAPAASPTVDDLHSSRAVRYVWSSDKSRYVDYLSRYPDDGATVIVYGRQGASHEIVDRPCAAGCVVEGAFWTDAAKFALLVRVPATKTDGSPFCLAAGAAAPRCYEKLAIEWFDLNAVTRTEFLSAAHLFASHPTDGERRARWASGLTPEEQVNAGAVPGADIIYAKGTIAVMSPDGASFTINQGEFGSRAVKIIAGTRVRDMHGEPVQLTYLRQGFTVDASGPIAADSFMVANKIDVSAAPRVLLTAPRPGEAVGATFGLLGAASRDAWPMTVTVSDAAGKTLFHKVIKAPESDAAAAYLDFVLEAKLVRRGLVEAQKLHLTVAPKDGQGAADLDLTYRP